MASGAKAHASGGAGRSGERKRTENIGMRGASAEQLCRLAGSENGHDADRATETGSMNGLFAVKNYHSMGGDRDGGELERTKTALRGSENGGFDRARGDAGDGKFLAGSMNGRNVASGGELERTTVS